MRPCKCFANEGIAPGEPSRLLIRQVLDDVAQRLDEENFR